MYEKSEFNLNEKHYTDVLKCSKETKKLILHDCVIEFLRYNPKFQGMNITQGFILKKIAEHYLESPPR